MKDAECAEPTDFSDLYFSSHGHFGRKMKIGKSENCFFIRFSTMRIFHENGSKTEDGGLHILTWDTAYMYSFIDQF